MKTSNWLRAGLAAALLALAPIAAQAAGITMFAAASLTDALNDVGKAYKAKTGNDVTFSFAASSVLAKQIEASGGAEIGKLVDDAISNFKSAIAYDDLNKLPKAFYYVNKAITIATKVNDHNLLTMAQNRAALIP